MKRIELVRWGVPTVAFLAYFKWGGFGLSFILFGILLTIISALINWHQKDHKGFHTGMRAWIVLFLILPSIALPTPGRQPLTSAGRKVSYVRGCA